MPQWRLTYDGIRISDDYKWSSNKTVIQYTRTRKQKKTLTHPHCLGTSQSITHWQRQVARKAQSSTRCTNVWNVQQWGGLPCGREESGLQYRGKERVQILQLIFPIMPSWCADGQLHLSVFVGAFPKSRWVTVSFITSVRPSVALNNSAPTGRIFTKFYICIFLLKIYR